LPAAGGAFGLDGGGLDGGDLHGTDGQVGTGGASGTGGNVGAGGQSAKGGAPGAGGSLTASGGTAASFDASVQGGRGGSGSGGSTDGSVPGTGGVGGGCQYKVTSGTATIQSVGTPGSADYNCPNNAKKVVFDFTPDDGSAQSNADHNVAFTVGAGMNPPEACLQANGIAVGAKLTGVVRKDLQSGSCSPLAWSLALPNAQLCLDKCWTN
jgi:hypothetical protein